MKILKASWGTRKGCRVGSTNVSDAGLGICIYSVSQDVLNNIKKITQKCHSLSKSFACLNTTKSKYSL